jgi:short-subunit dehydrogenase
MRRELSGRRILLTGASSGIGRCLAEQLALKGVRVAISARSGEKLADLADSLSARGCDVLPVTADVTLEEDRQRLLDRTVDAFGGLDVLINNAGVASWGHFADSTEAILRQVMEVNFFAPAELIRRAIPILVEGQEPAVVNVGSMCGRRGMPAWTEYSASKHALSGLTEALRGELARFDIDILIVQPGLTRSDFSRHFLRNDGRMPIDFAAGMPPEKAAAEIIRALERNSTETVLGRDARWFLRFQRYFPRLLDRLIARRVRKLYETN